MSTPARQRYHRKWYLENRQEKLRKNAAWARENRSRMRFLQRRWYKQNQKEHCRRCVENAARRASGSVEFRILRALRSRIWFALRGVYYSHRTLELVGCSLKRLRAHLEKQFRAGMSWENWGPVWHIDHRRPCASFDLTKERQRRACFHFSNLQPLFAGENRQKGSKWNE